VAPQRQDGLTARAAAAAPWNDTPRKRWAAIVATAVLIAVSWAVFYTVAMVAGSEERDRGTGDQGCEQVLRGDGARSAPGC
jgi:hypothetical protein